MSNITHAGIGIMPWHNVGTEVTEPMTAAEALALGELDWTVSKEPAYQRRTDGLYYPVKDRYAIVRSTDEHVLGIVGGDYTPFQNTEAFSFFDTVTDATSEAHYTNVGSLMGGKRVFIAAKVGDTFQVAGEDAHDLYLLIYSSHDGSRSFKAVVTPIRLACYNMVNLALNSAKTSWSLRHKTSLEGKAQEAREALKLSYKYMDAFEAEVEKLLEIEVTTDQFKSIVEGILPAQPRQLPKNVEELLAIWEHEPTVVETSAAGTGWGVVNAVSFWTDHTREYRQDEARMKSLTDGFAARIRNAAATRVLALA